MQHFGLVAEEIGPTCFAKMSHPVALDTKPEIPKLLKSPKKTNHQSTPAPVDLTMVNDEPQSKEDTTECGKKRERGREREINTCN